MKTRKKLLAAVMCVLLAILTVFAMMPNLSYADIKGGAPETKLSAPVKRGSWLDILNIYEAFAGYEDHPMNSIKGDILIKKSADRLFDTEHNQGYAVKDGDSYTLGLKLDVTGVKNELKKVQKQVLERGVDQKTLDVVGVKNLQSELVANISIPDGLDASSEEVQNALKHLQLGDNFGQYTSKASMKSVHVDNTDVGNYDLSEYKFRVTRATLDDHKNIKIVMDLHIPPIPKNRDGKSYDDNNQFNFACLYAVVENMPNVFTLEIPGIKADATKKIGKMTIKGSMGQQEGNTWDCYMQANLTYRNPPIFKFRTNWYATQLEGGQDALNSKGISLTAVRKAAVQYDANGGKGTMKPTEGILQDQVKAADNQFTRSGYSFSGWNTKADGSGETYKNGASVPLDDETVTLYAQWTENSTPVIPDTPVTPSEPQPPQKHEVTIHEDNPTKDKPETTTKITVDDQGKVEKPVTGDLHIYAKWNKNVNPQTAKKVTGILLPKAIANGSSHQTVTWTPLTNVDGYYVYKAHCNTPKKTYPFKKVADVKASALRVYKSSGLKKGVAYKYYVAAYQIKNGKKKVVKKSLSVHSIAGNLMRKRINYTNVKKVSVNKNTVTLKVGKTYRIQPSVKGVFSNCAILQKGHAAMFRYVYIKDGKNISVSSMGIVKAKKAGKCNVYVLGTNGVRTKVAVTVK